MEKENEALRYTLLSNVFNEGDNLKAVLFLFADGMANNPELVLKDDEELYESATLLGYLRAMLFDLRKRFPLSLIWHDADFQKTLLGNFSKNDWQKVLYKC